MSQILVGMAMIKNSETRAQKSPNLGAFMVLAAADRVDVDKEEKNQKDWCFV